MTSLVDHLEGLADDILTGETLVMHLRHLKKEGGVEQHDVNETLADVDWLKRRYTAIRIRAEATIARVELQDIPMTDRERIIREKFRGGQ